MSAATTTGWWHAENHLATAGMAAAVELVHCREAAAVRVAGVAAVALIVAAVYGCRTWLRIRSLQQADRCPPQTLGEQISRAFAGTTATSPPTGGPRTASAPAAS